MTVVIGVYSLVAFIVPGLGFPLPDWAIDIAHNGNLAVGGGFLVAVVCLSLNGIWLYRATAVGGYLRTVVIPIAVLCLFLVPALFIFSIVSRSAQWRRLRMGRSERIDTDRGGPGSGGLRHSPRPLDVPAATVGGYIRTVVSPLLAFVILLFVVACVLMVIFRPRDDGSYYSLGNPRELAEMGTILAAAAFLLLNGVWFYRTMPTGGSGRRAIHAAGWTLVCVVLFVMFWTPYESNRASWSGYLDGAIWPYRGNSDCTVSLEPIVPTCRRIVIREKAEINRSGYTGVDPGQRVGWLNYHIELTSLKGNPQGLNVDALNKMRWTSKDEKKGHRDGDLLDATALADWLASGDVDAAAGDPKEDDALMKKAWQEKRSAVHALQARAVMDIIRRAAKYHADGTRSIKMRGQTFDIQMHDDKWINRLRAATDQILLDDNQAFIRNPGWNSTENVEWRPEPPILVVGVPLMLAVWGIGLWGRIRYFRAVAVPMAARFRRSCLAGPALLMNGVRYIRLPPAIRIVGCAIGWTALCVALFALFGTPVDRTDNISHHEIGSAGYLDYWHWPYTEPGKARWS